MTIKELLSSPDKWCKKYLAVDADGKWVSPTSNKAVKWCLLGAITKCNKTQTMANALVEKDFIKLKNIIEKRYGMHITIFNDHPNTTFDTILEVFNEMENVSESA